MEKSPRLRFHRAQSRWLFDDFLDGKDLVECAVNELDGNLHGIEAMLAGEVNGALRMLKIKRLKGIGGPVAQTPNV